jgi:hypothetical protein
MSKIRSSKCNGDYVVTKEILFLLNAKKLEQELTSPRNSPFLMSSIHYITCEHPNSNIHQLLLHLLLGLMTTKLMLVYVTDDGSTPRLLPRILEGSSVSIVWMYTIP